VVPGGVFCCCSPSASRLCVLWLLKCFAAYLGCNEWLFQSKLLFYHLESVGPFWLPAQPAPPMLHDQGTPKLHNGKIACPGPRSPAWTWPFFPPPRPPPLHHPPELLISHTLPRFTWTTFPIKHLPGLITPNMIHLHCTDCTHTCTSFTHT